MQSGSPYQLRPQLQVGSSVACAYDCCTGRDVTTGLLLEAEPSPEVQGPLGALRRQLNQLQQPQADLGGYGRSDSTGPHTLKLLQATGSTTHLLQPAAKARAHRASGRTMSRAHMSAFW